MRITGGKARGIPLAVPRGAAVRPATDALRQALFSSIAARVEGAHFLDLFAGSGAYGLEALSRGAACGVWVERDRRAVACLEKNLAAVLKSLGQGVADKPEMEVHATDVASPRWEAEFVSERGAVDLVFIDPPYEVIEMDAPPLFARLRTLSLAMRSAPLVILECPGGLSLTPEGWHCIKRLGGKHRHQPSLALFELAG